MKNPGNRKNTPLDDRMKEYEAVTTSYSLIHRIPVYARIDGRAFHTFCRPLNKPFDDDFVSVMQKTCAYLVEKTNALVGYVESDEISLAWAEPSKMPFETRLFKLESVLAAMATSAFTLYGLETKLADRIRSLMPHFDCRVCQLPDLSELANMFVWRQQDCLKNSITMVALSKFSHNELQGKNSVDKVNMLLTKGINYYDDIAEHLRLGSFFRRELYYKTLTADEVNKIPEKNRGTLLHEHSTDGIDTYAAIRSHVVQFYPEYPLQEIENKIEVLFNHATAERKA